MFKAFNSKHFTSGGRIETRKTSNDLEIRDAIARARQDAKFGQKEFVTAEEIGEVIRKYWGISPIQCARFIRRQLMPEERQALRISEPQRKKRRIAKV